MAFPVKMMKVVQMLENGWGPKLMKIWCEAFRLGPLVKNFGIFVLVKKKARMPSRNTGNFSRTFSPAKLVAALPLVQPPQSFPPAGKLLWEGAKGVVVSRRSRLCERKPLSAAGEGSKGAGLPFPEQYRFYF